ncbi:MAG TPA: hypothetical protein VF950_23430 [Planctomycetota bacterium]
MPYAWGWPDLLRHLGGPLHAFVRRLAESPHADVLHAYLSLRSVCVARTREIEVGQERLIVCYDPKHGRLHMAYTDWGTWDVDGPTPLIRGQDSWVRDYAPDEAWPAFLKFLRRVGWVPDADRA